MRQRLRKTSPRFVSQDGMSYCCKFWGLKLQERIRHLYDWANKTGLEQTADVFLSQLHQVLYLLSSPKNVESLSMLVAKCCMLNSIQVKMC